MPDQRRRDPVAFSGGKFDYGVQMQIRGSESVYFLQHLNRERSLTRIDRFGEDCDSDRIPFLNRMAFPAGPACQNFGHRP